MKEKIALRTIYLISAIVFAAVVVLFNLPKQESIPDFVRFLPRLNAMLNASCSLLLITSWILILRKQIDWHKRLNMMAFVLSSLFLVSYIIFHAFGVETRYPADSPYRSIYLFILISHIILAATVLPLVLLSFYRGLSGQTAAHRKIGRWTMPIWLYVTVTGVVVYLMISPYYTF